jgi:hypothetical protein
MKHLRIITDGKFAAGEKEQATFPTIIAEGLYSEEDVLGAVYLCWYKELVEEPHFPADDRIAAARALTAVAELILRGKESLKITDSFDLGIDLCYGFGSISPTAFLIIKDKKDYYCEILENVTRRIKAAGVFKTEQPST